MPASCDGYVAHAFKKDVCRECGQHKDKHVVTSAPAPTPATTVRVTPALASRPTLPAAQPTLPANAPVIVAPPAKPTTSAATNSVTGSSIAPTAVPQTFPSTSAAAPVVAGNSGINGGSGGVCGNFVSNAYVTKICRNCAKTQAEHTSASNGTSTASSVGVQRASISSPLKSQLSPAQPVASAPAVIHVTPIKPLQSSAPMSAPAAAPASAPATPNSSSCANPTPYGFNTAKCKNCQQPIAQHMPSTAGAAPSTPAAMQSSTESAASRSPALPALAAWKSAAPSKACTEFVTHAFFPQKCRSCGQPKADHQITADSHSSSPVPVADTATAAVAHRAHSTSVTADQPHLPSSKPTESVSPIKPVPVRTAPGIHARLASLGSFNPLAAKAPAPVQPPAPALGQSVEPELLSSADSTSLTSPPGVVRKPTIAVMRRQASGILPHFNSPSTSVTGSLTSPVSAPPVNTTAESTTITVTAERLTDSDGTSADLGSENDSRITTNTPVTPSTPQTQTRADASLVPVITSVQSMHAPVTIHPIRSAALFDDTDDIVDVDFFRTKKPNTATAAATALSTAFAATSTSSNPTTASSALPDVGTSDEWDVGSSDIDDTINVAPPIIVYRHDTAKSAPLREEPLNTQPIEQTAPVHTVAVEASRDPRSSTTAAESASPNAALLKPSPTAAFFFPGRSISSSNSAVLTQPADAPVSVSSPRLLSPGASKPTATFFRTNSLGFEQSVKDAITVVSVGSKDQSPKPVEPASEQLDAGMSARTGTEPKVAEPPQPTKKKLFDEDDDLFTAASGSGTGRAAQPHPPPPPPSQSEAALASATAHLKIENPLARLLAQRHANQHNVFDDDDDNQFG